MRYTIPHMKRLLKKLTHVQQFVLLHIMYGIGIGIPSVIAKLAGVHFLPGVRNNSTWVKHKPSHSHETMY